MKFPILRSGTFRHLAGAVAALALTVPSAPVGAQTRDAEILRVVEAAYAGISANADESRDWRAFHALFLPEARLTSVGTNRDGVRTVRNSSVADWVVTSGLGLAGRGFIEEPIHHRIESYGPITHVFTTWVTRSERGGAANNYGAATLQLVQTEDGWHVASWIWTGEVEGEPLPGRSR